MANKEIKKLPLNKECLNEALKFRNCSIRSLGRDYKFGWSSKSVERGIKEGLVSTELIDALGQYLDVDPNYLSGIYHRDIDRIKDESVRNNLKLGLKVSKFPYFLSKRHSLPKGKFLYDYYLENILNIHDISTMQFDNLDLENKRDFQLELEDAIAQVLLRYFKKNSLDLDLYPEVYRLKSEIEDYYYDIL